MHLEEDRNIPIRVVVNPDNAFMVVKPVQPSDILLKCPVPRDRHCKKKRIQPGVIKAFSDISPRCDQDPTSVIAGMNLIRRRLALLFAKPAF